MTAPRLPLPRRRTSWRSVKREMTCREIAAVLGVTSRAVEMVLARALAKTRAALGAGWGTR